MIAAPRAELSDRRISWSEKVARARVFVAVLEHKKPAKLIARIGGTSMTASSVARVI